MDVAWLSFGPLLLASSPVNIANSKSFSKPKSFAFETNPISIRLYTANSSTLSTFFAPKDKRLCSSQLSSINATFSSFSSEYIVEPTTNVKFETSLSLPGCPRPLSLLGTGHREKVFAFIGVKVYAAGLYANLSIIDNLNAWRGRSEASYQDDPTFFNSIYQVPVEKALKIELVRNIEGETFWNALNDAISPRIKGPAPDDKSSLSKFRSIFKGQSLNKGTIVLLIWLDPSKMLVTISSDGSASTVEATIESANINLALFDVFFGDAPVSPSLKAMVCNGLAKILK